ncbi:phosphomevalonate kinase [Strongylocentrotus purpuratus]|uniref:Phosphomevalonate kinase n=1 Tax=Strongylocentrotus purpuratus TaxID=7668 RepID=A0A7M7N7L5_STRPU|nr:phosphomevalonate kinase [Strongylocentrotus purpuratus]XP_030832375.1 phosphomevalonate kinase [Strongylocentrotus purpuratus]
MDSSHPKAVLVFSGKRKSGKDFTCALLKERLGDVCTILTLSAPLKCQFAEIHGLDYEQLLSASSYKERYRHDMVVWGEKKRNEDPSIFCRLATLDVSTQHKVWLISDARRKTDVAYFKETYSDRAKLVRVQADESIRASRGYVFKKGVDDSETECGLDEGVLWDYVITNNGDEDDLDRQLTQLISSIQDGLINEIKTDVS